MKYALATILIFILSACAVSGQSHNTSTQELIFHGKVSLLLSDEPVRMWLTDGPTLITENANIVSYGVIDQESIRFIGSKKTPFEFITSAFSEQKDDVELSFYQAFEEYSLKTATNNEFSFYELTGKSDKYIYITAPEVNFIIEVFSKDPNAISLPNIIQQIKHNPQGD